MSFTLDDLDQIYEAMRRADETGELGTKVVAWCAARLTPEELASLTRATECFVGETYGTGRRYIALEALDVIEKLKKGLAP